MRKFLKIFSITISTIILLTIFGIGVFLLSYSRWYTEFRDGMLQENLILSDSSMDETLVKKISLFTLSEQDTDFLSLTPSEFGHILLSVLDEYLENKVSIERVYIEPSLSSWNIYLEMKYRVASVWTMFTLKKDNVQSAQLYVTDIKIGYLSLPFLIEKINDGIASGLVVVNENGFSGRYLENIELLDDKIVVKGSRY